MKKKSYLKKVLVVLTLFLFGVLKVNAATNPYKPTSRFGPNCTWHAWDETYKRLGIALPGWGNANTWYDYAKRAGFEVGQTPRAHSIAVWEWDKYGHVAYVDEVKGNTIYTYEAGNYCIDTENEEYRTCIENGVSEETDRACAEKYGKKRGCPRDATYMNVPGDLIGYIYLDHVPSRPVSSTPKTTIKKSNNADLSSIKISNIDFDFKKDTLEYNLVVENVLESINVEATTEHNKAKVEGIGEHQLNIGDNTIELVVTAEDGSKKTYTIKVRRKDNDAYLSSLNIQNIDFEFNKDTFEYELEVARDIESIVVEGTLESETSKIEGLGDYTLYEEETTINLIVTAEDETQNTYTLKIKKEPKVEESISKKKINFWIILGSILASLVVIGSIVIVVMKKKNKKK